MAYPSADPDRSEQAIRHFRRRVPMTDPEFRALSEAELERAFWVAGVTEASTVQDVFDAVDRAIEQGTTLEDFKADVGETLAESWGGEDAPRLETVFRTNIMSSYNGGRHEMFSDPAVKAARPYLRFDGVGDSRQSEICEALDGKVLPADDPFWLKHTPPLHFNCRSVLTPLDPEEAHGEGISDGPPDTGGAAPDEGFGRPPTPEDATPDLSGFDPEIAAATRARIPR
jgi:SPP1 gp7 family putative phage head morphogenesis protein